MKDYIYEARKHGISIYSSSLDNDLVCSYTLNKENNHVMIKHMKGNITTEEISKEKIEELNGALGETLKKYCDQIFPKIKQQTGWKWSIVGLDLLNASLQYASQNYFAGTCWLTCSGLYYLQIHGPLKLKREMQLVSWIHENRDKVNEIIKEEVESKIEKPEITAQTLNMPTYEYPTSLVPYPENIYEEGINLNNIDALNNRQLRKLKRKVLSRERSKI